MRWGLKVVSRVKERHEIAERYRWNAESVYEDDAAWEVDYGALTAELAELEAYRGTLNEGPERLAAWLEHLQSYQTRFWKLYVYANMRYSCNTLDEQAAAQRQRAAGLLARFAAATAFAEPELASIGFDQLRAWVEKHEALRVYAHYFDKLAAQAEHLRSSEVEELLGALQDPFGAATQIHGVLANSDLSFKPAVDEQGEEHEISQGTIRALLASPDRTLRESAWTNYADAHLAFKHTMAAALATGIKQNLFLARARRYASALEMALAPEKIPLEVFYTLIETFKRHLPVWHRYWRVRKQMLGVKTLREYDIFAPLTEASPKVSYEEAVGWICEAMKPLGEAYVETMRRGALEERWVDVYPNKGKRMGAFSSGISKATYPFIMMSYSDDLFGMSTLAHELGHSMHSHLSWQHQPQLYRYSLFVAEVASNFNQAMTRAHLFEQRKGREFEVALIEEAMANFHRYFFVMPTLARFELELHERVSRGEALGAERMNALMAELFAEGYGDELSFDAKRTGITWAQFHTHLYSRFYVYQYATGIAGAHVLAKSVLEGAPGAAERYLAFLRAGGSKYPLDALREAGVDLTTPQPVEEAFEVLDDLIGRLEVLAG
jgi:oligoendopeptidase F